MSPVVIVVANQKGGSSKTTVCAHLAVAAAKAGLRVCIADTDPQSSLAEWWGARKASDVSALKADALRDFTAAVRGLDGSCDVLVVDTPPGTGNGVRSLVAAADFVLIPCRASPHDLRAVRGTLALLQGKPFGFCLTQAVPNSAIVVQAMAALSAHGEVSAAVVGSRVAYASAMTDGRTAPEIDPKGKAASETAALWKWVAAKAGAGK